MLDSGWGQYYNDEKPGKEVFFALLQPDRLAFGIVPWYSLIIVSGIALGIFLCGRGEKRLALPKDTAIDCALWAIPLGIIGARLYYVAFSWEQFSNNLVRILYVWEGGVAIYGALIGGLLGVWLNAWRKKISLLTLLDMLSPSVVLAQALGRWGNFFNMEAYGELVSNPKWQFFPFSVYIPTALGGEWYLATFFYESVWNLLCFILLMAFRKRMKQRGDVFFWYLLLYGAGRAVVEGLRLDSLMWLNGTIRVSQWLSLLAMAAVFILFAIRMFKKGGRKIRFAAAVLFLVHSFYLVYVGSRHVQIAYIWPYMSIAILVLCAIFMSWPVAGKGIKTLIPFIPFWVLSASLAIFLVYWNGAQNMLSAQTAFITLISLSIPAGALTMHPLPSSID